MTAKLIAAGRALLIAGLGVLFASAWGRGEARLAFTIVALVMFVGALGELLGHGLLPDSPTAAVFFLETAYTIPLALASALTGVCIVVASKLLVATTAAPLVRQTSTVLVAAVVAFVSASVLAITGDDKESVLGLHIRSVFRRYFVRTGSPKKIARAAELPAGSRAERWVYSNEFGGIEGWGAKARRARAKGLAAELKMQGL